MFILLQVHSYNIITKIFFFILKFETPVIKVIQNKKEYILQRARSRNTVFSMPYLGRTIYFPKSLQDPSTMTPVYQMICLR